MELFSKQGRFDNTHTHIELTKSHAVDGTYQLGLATELQAKLWYNRWMFEEAKLEALHAIGLYEKVGATKNLERCRELLEKIDRLDSDGELLEMIRHKNDTKKVNDGMLMLNVMSHRMDRDDENDCSHDGCRSRPMRRQSRGNHS